MRRKIVFYCGIVGAMIFAITSVIGGLQIEGYNFISQYISESYATGIPNVEYLQYLFIVSGILLAIFAFMAPSVLPKSKSVGISFSLFAIFYGLGTVMTGIFPCDLGCQPDPINPSVSQFIHNTFGFLAYAITPFSIIAIGLSSKKWQNSSNISAISIICGIMSFCFVLLLFQNATGAFIGLYQRIIECCILLWVIYSSLFIKNNHQI